MKRTCVLLMVGLLLVAGCVRRGMLVPSPGSVRTAPAQPPARAVGMVTQGVVPPTMGVMGSTHAYTGVSEEVPAQPRSGAASAPGLASPPTDPGETQRVMIYNAVMSLVVDNIQDARETVRKETERAGGYMQAMDAASIVVKVPAAKFLEVIAAVEKLGEVTQKEVKGTDVTEQMRDLQIRLKNAEEVRKRLVVLLDHAESVEDALKVERELERVTESIELFKGKIKALENQVAFSTLTVYLNSPLPQRIIKEEVPFPWVTELAGDMAKGSVIEMPTRTGGRRVVFDPPQSFAKYHEADYVTRATSADGVFIKVERHPNVEGADLAFWSKLIRRSLTAKQAIVVKQERDTTIRDNVAAKIIEGVKEISSEEYGYLVAVAQTDDYVYTYEAWGPSKEFAKAKESLEKSIRSMNVLTFLGSLFR